MRWSRRHSCWYLPSGPETLKRLFDYLVQQGFWVDYSNLKAKPGDAPDHQKQEQPLSPSQLVLLDRYQRYLQGLHMAPSTVQSYGYFIKRFLAFLGGQPLSETDNSTVRAFVEALVAKNQYGVSSHRQLIGAIKHFANLFSESRINGPELVRPRRSRHLPTILNQQEVLRLLQSTPNLKHRTAIALLYSSGLRISELLNLEIRHLDLERKQLHVVQGKGRKDRYVVLAESLVPLLLNYLNSYRPKRLLLEGDGGGRYSGSSVRSFLKRSCRRAGIRKAVTPHTLRHSYATHLIENGVNLRHVQELLGHTKPETTMVYTHVARRDLLQVRSPLDDVVQKALKADKNDTHILLSGDL